MKKITLQTILFAFIFTMPFQVFPQTMQESGAFYCSMKKQHSPQLAEPDAGPNTPQHSFDVTKYTLEADFYDNFFSPFPNNFEACLVVSF